MVGAHLVYVLSKFATSWISQIRANWMVCAKLVHFLIQAHMDSRQFGNRVAGVNFVYLFTKHVKIVGPLTTRKLRVRCTFRAPWKHLQHVWALEDQARQEILHSAANTQNERLACTKRMSFDKQIHVFGGAAAEYICMYSVGSPCIKRFSPCIRYPSTCIRRDLGSQVGVFGFRAVYSAGLVYSATTSCVYFLPKPHKVHV